MRFVDQVFITAKAGSGGDGCAAFRREAHVPRGGPAGGDGGRGGDVIFIADSGLMTLLDLRYQRIYKAKNGGPGQGRDKYGRKGASCEVRVPCGTLVYDAETNEVVGDLIEHQQRLIVARGGRGGWGNLHFVSSTNRAPREAEDGEPGEERKLRVELKLIAEVGLVGLPNAGKSTLISRVSSAKPKIADYPFTTLRPNLGVVGMSDERSFVMADIPGLIEGAHQGVGLGHQFLRHIERTKILVFLLDDRMDGEEPGDPKRDLRILRDELSAYRADLLNRPCVVALNKIDAMLPEDVERLTQDMDEPLLPISAVSGAGLKSLLEAVWRTLKSAKNDGDETGDEVS